MFKIATTLTVLSLALAGSAFAQDYRSPDARRAVVQQDYRSPDARSVVVDPSTGFSQDLRSPDARSVVVDPSTGFSQDLRSPDARRAGAFQPSVPSEPAHASNSFDWGYLAVGIAAALILLAGFMLTQRRRRHGLAIGS